MEAADALRKLGLDAQALLAIHAGHSATGGLGKTWVKHSPIDGRVLATFPLATDKQASQVTARARQAFEQQRNVPAPLRGEFVRRFGNALRENKAALGALVTWEAGKIRAEGEGEVQEMIDVCDFAVGQSRQLYGKTMPSERPEHRLTELWHPLGPVGVISAFNFPVAVWAWNAALAWVCGDPVVWKPSEKTPLCALACHQLAMAVLAEMPEIPDAISSVVIGGAEVGQALAASAELPLISATGSVAMGRQVAQTVAERLGRSLLELGGNNAAVVAPSANLELAVRAIAFSAFGTAGQRCTTLRRLFVHESLYDELFSRLSRAYASARVGNPLDATTLVGPLIDEAAYDGMCRALDLAKQEGGKVIGGQRVTAGVPAGGVYVRPALVELAQPTSVTEQETFAPILYVVPYRELSQAILWNNAVPQGLSSAIFTNDVREAEQFYSAAGSDCGIVNVNIGTSGAEIGGAFGGEKETGGGRESGSDAWKTYMRRVTTTVNYGNALPLAQGIHFDVGE